jgi:opacity protein-like surface antigen
VDGDYEGLSAFAMAYYDFAAGSQITLYIGLGIGLVDAELEATTPGAFNDATRSNSLCWMVQIRSWRIV